VTDDAHRPARTVETAWAPFAPATW
jgi:hypothetical protein